jgi:hypothetical protein
VACPIRSLLCYRANLAARVFYCRLALFFQDASAAMGAELIAK